jgi:hypothetical protein
MKSVAMADKKHLYVLRTSDNRITADKMVFMYTVNALAYGWWEQVTLILWGAAATLVGEDEQGLAILSAGALRPEDRSTFAA